MQNIETNSFDDLRGWLDVDESQLPVYRAEEKRN